MLDVLQDQLYSSEDDIFPLYDRWSIRSAWKLPRAATDSLPTLVVMYPYGVTERAGAPDTVFVLHDGVSIGASTAAKVTDDIAFVPPQELQGSVSTAPHRPASPRTRG